MSGCAKAPVIEKKRGDTISLAFYFGDGSADGYSLTAISDTLALPPIDLTGASARLQLRDKNDVLYFDANLTNYLTIPAPTNGYVYLSIPPEASRKLPIAQLYGDLEITYTSGIVESTRDFVLSIIKDQTRPS